MRVYEFAKEHGLSSKEVLALLEEGGFSVKSHMSIVSDDAHTFLKKKYSKKPATKTSSAAKASSQKVSIKKEIAPKKGAAPKKTTEPKPAKPVRKKDPKSQAKKTMATQPTTQTESKQKSMTATPTRSTPQSAPKPKPSATPKRPSRPAGRQGGSRARNAAKKARRHALRRERLERHIPKDVTEITLTHEMPLHKAADMMGKTSGELILVLLKKGMMCNRNHMLTVESIADIAKHFEITVHDPIKAKQTSDLVSATPEDSKTRWPIAVVMGHVDHGKTTLLDYIRKHNVAAGEKGGITQHLGAYEVDSAHGKIVLLDTPGHQAFSYMRQRGARVTDIAILVVAADDGIKPQTLEAIKHAQDAKVPMIVAINKIDKVEDKVTAIERVKRQLAENDLIAEDWGGDIICVPVSALTGEGVGDLLEMLVLQAEMSDLKANPNSPAQAFVLESKLEKGFGPVATVIPLEGTIRRGDYFVCGSSTGKVRLLINSSGEKIMQAGPSIPVQVVGFDEFVSLGDWLKVVPVKEYSKAKSSKSSVISQMSAPSQGFLVPGQDEHSNIGLVVKTDTQGSMQAISDSIAELNEKHKTIPASFQIIQSGIGNISERDVFHAHDTGALVLGLHVSAEKNAQTFAKDKNIKVMTNQIIYKLLEELEAILITYKKAKIITRKVATATVRKVFDVKGLGVIAGCYVNDGVITKGNKVVCMRNGEKIGEGKIDSLQRERKTVKQVHGGFECGFIVQEFTDWQENDIAEVFVEEKEIV